MRAVKNDPSPAVDIGVETNIGNGRASNQDAFWMAPETMDLRTMGRLVAVADGMGGHKAGAVASRVASQALGGYYKGQRKPVRATENCRRLVDLIFRIDRHLRRQALADPDLEDMGTTLSCLVLNRRHTIIAHVGDSRIYRLRRGRLCCLTGDHTFVADMIAVGDLSPRQAANHPLRHMLTQAVGAGEPLETVQARVDRREEEDRFLLCTDGLHTVLGEDRIAASLGGDASAGDIAKDLVTQALTAGGRDNITALVLRPAPQSGGRR